MKIIADKQIYTHKFISAASSCRTTPTRTPTSNLEPNNDAMDVVVIKSSKPLGTQASNPVDVPMDGVIDDSFDAVKQQMGTVINDFDKLLITKSKTINGSWSKSSRHQRTISLPPLRPLPLQQANVSVKYVSSMDPDHRRAQSWDRPHTQQAYNDIVMAEDDPDYEMAYVVSTLKANSETGNV